MGIDRDRSSSSGPTLTDASSASPGESRSGGSGEAALSKLVCRGVILSRAETLASVARSRSARARVCGDLRALWLVALGLGGGRRGGAAGGGGPPHVPGRGASPPPPG